MPTYQYRCRECGHELDVVQKFSDDPLTACPRCSGALRKIFSPVGVVFKGSGFYKTDSRATSGTRGTAATAGAKSDGDSGADAAGTGAAERKPEAKPAGGSEPKPASTSTTGEGGTSSASKPTVDKVA